MSKSKFWVLLKQYNLLVKSLCPYNIVLRQFNLLSPQMRQEIKTRLELCDKIRKTKIPSNEGDAILTCIMVDAHIIACEYDVVRTIAVVASVDHVEEEPGVFLVEFTAIDFVDDQT